MNDKCRLTGDKLTPVIDLGPLCVSNFVDDPRTAVSFPLKLGLGPRSGLLQLYDSYPPEALYQNEYWYLSGINESMRDALHDIVKSSQRFITLEPKDVVLDIGCNDGTLLSFWPEEVYRVGIDPAANLRPFALRHCDSHVTGFFSRAAYESAVPVGCRAKVITSIAMFYDVEDPHDWVEQLRACLDPAGLWIIQMSYMPLMIQQNAFDNICHEHITYYTLTVMERLLRDHDLQIVDAELNNVNGGSFRLYVCHKGADLGCPTFERDLGNYRVASLLEHESRQRLDTPDIYKEFIERVGSLRCAARSFLEAARANGKQVIGYGASTKGNTLLQFYGITPEWIPAIADRSPAKWGKYGVGSGIPIISEETMRRLQPDYLFVLPWHFAPLFIERERALITTGTRLVVPLPEVLIFDGSRWEPFESARLSHSLGTEQ
jgi:hypothetical protein